MSRLPSFESLWANYPNGTPDEVKANQAVIDAYLGVAH